MKIINNYRGKLFMLLITVMTTRLAFAQEDKKIDVNINVNKGNQQWYMQPWVWVVAGAVFILLLAAILRSNKKE